MTVFPSDIHIDETIVRKVVADQFAMVPRTLQLLGEGFDNAVYLVDNTIVFRFPRRREAVALIEREIECLPKLSTSLSLAIPFPEFIGHPSRDFSRPFYGHKLLPGRSGCSVKLSDEQYQKAAKTLGHFLRELHEIDPQVVGLKKWTNKPLYDRVDMNLLLKFYRERHEQNEKNYDLTPYEKKFSQIIDDAKSYQTSDEMLRLIHSDLYHRHCIFSDENDLCGIIDWGDCAVGDKTADLGIVFQFFPKEAHASFFAAYGYVAPTNLRYARFLGLYYAAALLWFGHDRGDHDLIRTSFLTFAQI